MDFADRDWMPMLKDFSINLQAGQACAWLRAADRGSADWWRRLAAQGAPLVDRVAAARVCVTFLWRDPHGGAAQSPLRRVYADVNSVTDHHSPQPQSLQRLDGSDVWCWQVELPADWRGSYAFIPVTQPDVVPPLRGDEDAQRLAQRHWWRSIQPLAQADPLNPRFARSDRSLSALHLPDAPAQPGWDGGEACAPAVAVHELQWRSARLGDCRSVWLFATGAANPPAPARRPLVLLLDGSRWQHDLPIHAALAAQTAAGRLPPAVYVLIDAVDGLRRERDLACSAVFWQALQAELLPQVAALAPHSGAADDTVVAGQSLGGLAAVYACLHFGRRFGAALSQSGSFWWPQVELLQAPPGQPCPRRPGARGELARWLAQQPPAAVPRRVFLEVGRREDVMIDLNLSLRDALAAAGHVVAYREYEGGHDALCWRGGLIDGLCQLLAPPQP